MRMVPSHLNMDTKYPPTKRANTPNANMGHHFRSLSKPPAPKKSAQQITPPPPSPSPPSGRPMSRASIYKPLPPAPRSRSHHRRSETKPPVPPSPRILSARSLHSTTTVDQTSLLSILKTLDYKALGSNGRMHCYEFKQAMMAFRHHAFGADDVLAIFKDIDQDKDNYILHTEYKDWIGRLNSLHLESLTVKHKKLKQPKQQHQTRHVQQHSDISWKVRYINADPNYKHDGGHAFNPKTTKQSAPPPRPGRSVSRSLYNKPPPPAPPRMLTPKSADSMLHRHLQPTSPSPLSQHQRYQSSNTSQTLSLTDLHAYDSDIDDGEELSELTLNITQREQPHTHLATQSLVFSTPQKLSIISGMEDIGPLSLTPLLTPPLTPVRSRSPSRGKPPAPPPSRMRNSLIVPRSPQTIPPRTPPPSSPKQKHKHKHDSIRVEKPNHKRRSFTMVPLDESKTTLSLAALSDVNLQGTSSHTKPPKLDRRKSSDVHEAFSMKRRGKKSMSLTASLSTEHQKFLLQNERTFINALSTDKKSVILDGIKEVHTEILCDYLRFILLTLCKDDKFIHRQNTATPQASPQMSLIEQLKAKQIEKALFKPDMDAKQNDSNSEQKDILSARHIRKYKADILDTLKLRMNKSMHLQQHLAFICHSYPEIQFQCGFKTIPAQNKDVIKFWTKLANKQRIFEGYHIKIDAKHAKNAAYIDRVMDPIMVDQTIGAVSMVEVRKMINSNAKPLLLDIYSHGELLSSVILKKGDDLRKDAAMMSTFKYMNQMWRKQNVQYEGEVIHIVTYKVVPVSQTFGFIEWIADCIGLRDIKDVQQHLHDNDAYIRNLVTSSAAAYISCFVCGVRDRHFDNQMIRRCDYRLFHIDFNFIFGEKASLDASELGITKTLYNIMGDKYKVFVRLACDAYQVLRTYHKELIECMQTAFKFLYARDTVEEFLRKKLRLDLSDEDAKQWMTKKLMKAPQSTQTALKNTIHNIALNMQSSNSVSQDASDDEDVLSD